MMVEMVISTMRDGGQLGAEVLEDLLKRGHDLDHDERQDADGDQDDDDRVDHRPFDLAFERLGLLHELGQALQNDFQAHRPPRRP